MSEINFIDYDKITIRSDAFISSDDLNCYLQYFPSTKALSYNIKKDKHTAGTTNDPDDYKVPDIREKLSPKKLFRINPFHKNYAEYLELHKTNTDPEIIFPTIATSDTVSVVENDYSDMGLNQDQIDFLLALKNLKNLKVEDVSKKLDIEKFEITDDKLMEGFFQVYPRYMESLVATSGLQETLAYEEPEETFSYNDDSTSMDYHLKKMGLNPQEVKVKKNFQVRTGNAKDKQITPFLQDKIIEKQAQTKLSVTNNTENISNINISNKNKNEYTSRLSTSSFTNNQAYNSLIQNINSSKNISINQNIRIRKSVEQEQVDYKNVFNKLLKDLSLKNDVTNLYNREINLHSRNITFEFLSQINQSFSKEYNTNIRNQTSAYNFYRYIENRYREFVQNLNFLTETFQEFKRTEYKIRNSYQNIHQHNFTQKNQYNKNIINLTKEINFENNMIDYNFQSAILKTVEKTNTITKNNIEKIKESLNIVQNNVSYVNRKVSHLSYRTENRISKEVKNILNNQEFSDDYSNIIINKISNVANSSEIKKLLSIVKNEETLQNLSFIVKQSGVSAESIKQISEVINLSKNNNFNISKISNESIQNVKNLVSLSETYPKNFTISNYSSNVTENLKQLVNISQSQDFVLLSKSFKNISPVLKFISENNSSFRTSKVSNFNQVNNLINQVSNIKSFSNIENKISSISQSSNITNELSQVANLKAVVNQIQKLSKIQDVKIFEQLNILSEPKISKSLKIIKKVSQIKNVNELEQNISLVNQTAFDKKEVNLKTSNLNQVNKFINLIENTRLDSSQITALSKLSTQNINSVVQMINNVSLSKNNVNKIINEIVKIEESKVYKISNLNQSQISNINLSKNEVKSVVKLERQIRNYSEKVKIRETLKTLDLIESKPEINQFFTNKISKYNLNQISEVLQNINLIKNSENLKQITKFSFESNKKNISNVYNELNITSIEKSERKTERSFTSINKQIDKLYKMSERIESKASRAEQSFFDLINFSDYSVTKKTSTKKEIKNFFQTLNQVKITNEQIKERIKPSIKVNEFRITQSSEKVKIDIHKQKTDNYYKVENVNRFYKKSYHEEKQEKEAQEKVIESKVEELLVRKIQTVTNNITNNVITKQEINNIKQEIIREIFKVEEKYEQKIQAIKQETQQTVQSMLSQFLKS